MKNGHIENVKILTPGPDEDLIRQAEEAFRAHADQGIEDVEVWDGARFVYRSSDARPIANAN
jgi:hypothetical protein